MRGPFLLDILSQEWSLSSRWSRPVPITDPVVVSAGEESSLASVILGSLHHAPRRRSQGGDVGRCGVSLSPQLGHLPAAGGGL